MATNDQEGTEPRMTRTILHAWVCRSFSIMTAQRVSSARALRERKRECRGLRAGFTASMSIMIADLRTAGPPEEDLVRARARACPHMRSYAAATLLVLTLSKLAVPSRHSTAIACYSRPPPPPPDED